MLETIRLFNLLPVKSSSTREPSKALLEESIKRGVLFSPTVCGNYTDAQLMAFLKDTTLSGEDYNKSFHKSWKKVRDASIEQLVAEQIVHYITTYGFESLGIYDELTVFVPIEKLEVPDVTDQFTFKVIRGADTDALRDKLMTLFSGIALKESTMEDSLAVATYVGIGTLPLDEIKNKEVMVQICDQLGTVPLNPVEFLRYVVYKCTGTTLLIKSKRSISYLALHASETDIDGLFYKYFTLGGTIENLASIFYRFKPIFLALRQTKKTKKTINKIRRKAEHHHRPMKESFLNKVTENIKHYNLDMKELKHELENANIYRAVRLAQAIQYRLIEPEGIIYFIRNGRAFVDEFTPLNGQQFNIAFDALNTITEHIVDSLDLAGKKVYIPDFIEYAIPATEKQYVGEFPIGTTVTVEDGMVVGVYWKNLPDTRVDLDLSLMSFDGKIGWDRINRTSDRSIMFSGDITDAPNGATECFYIDCQKDGEYVLYLNYFNCWEADKVSVPFKLFVADTKLKNLNENYMVDPNLVKAEANVNLDFQQGVIGFIKIKDGHGTFTFVDTGFGKGRTARNSEQADLAQSALLTNLKSRLSFNLALENAGVELVAKPEEADINLSPSMIEKTTFIDLLASQ